MRYLRSSFVLCFFLAVAFFATTPARGQATRTWVSGVGDDVNPCSRTAPCKTFAGAISKTAAGGEISVLDPGGFGAVTITKSITIDGTGTLGSILASGVNGVTINITGPPETVKSVRLRGLSINGAGTGINGVRVIAADRVTIEDCVIDGFTNHGINVQAGTVFVRNTVIRNNVVAGLGLSASGAQAALSDSSFVFNGAGVAGPASSTAQFGNVVFYGNKTGDPKRP